MRYSELAEIYEELEATTKRLEKTFILTRLFKTVPKDEIKQIVYLAQGRIFPAWDEREIGISTQLGIRAIALATGSSESVIRRRWREIGDLGKVAEEAVRKKTQTALTKTILTTQKVSENLIKAAEATGPGTVERKIKLAAELIGAASPIEARYVLRTILEELRIGVGEGAIRDAIVWAFFPPIAPLFTYCSKCKNLVPVAKHCISCKAAIDKPDAQSAKAAAKKLKLRFIKDDVEDVKKLSDAQLKRSLIFSAQPRKVYNHLSSLVQSAYDIATDFGLVAEAALKGPSELRKIGFAPGKPVKVMLALKTDKLEEGFAKVGRPAQLEFKYDGFRLMINYDGKQVKLFTRRLDNVTAQFPEVVDYVKKYVKGKSFILDSEAVGFDPETLRYRPFQEVSQRIKRKYGIKRMATELPVEVNVFDILYYNGKNLITEPFKERRRLLEKAIKPAKRKIVLAEKLVTDSEEQAKAFFDKALEIGEEGIMMKNLSAPYKPGARVGYMLKFKPTLPSLDLAITGAEWGTGKRSGWLSSFILACQHEGELLEIGKVGTGIKEKPEEGLSFPELTKMLKPLIKKTKGRYSEIKPDVVLEVTFQEIQRSPKYSSKFALRFPRVVRLRPDKSVKDVETIKKIKKLYAKQKRGK